MDVNMKSKYKTSDKHDFFMQKDVLNIALSNCNSGVSPVLDFALFSLDKAYDNKEINKEEYIRLREDLSSIAAEFGRLCECTKRKYPGINHLDTDKIGIEKVVRKL